jgi:hypothetical protein
MVNWSKHLTPVLGLAFGGAVLVALYGQPWQHHGEAEHPLPGPAAVWVAAPDAHLCAVTCPGYSPVPTAPATGAQAQAVAAQERAAAAYWHGQPKVTVTRTNGLR